MLQRQMHYLSLENGSDVQCGGKGLTDNVDGGYVTMPNLPGCIPVH